VIIFQISYRLFNWKRRGIVHKIIDKVLKDKELLKWLIFKDRHLKIDKNLLRYQKRRKEKKNHLRDS